MFYIYVNTVFSWLKFVDSVFIFCPWLPTPTLKASTCLMLGLCDNSVVETMKSLQGVNQRVVYFIIREYKPHFHIQIHHSANTFKTYCQLQGLHELMSSAVQNVTQSGEELW